MLPAIEFTAQKLVGRPRVGNSIPTPKRGRRGVLGRLGSELGQAQDIYGGEFVQGLLPLPLIADKEKTPKAADILEKELSRLGDECSISEGDTTLPGSVSSGRQVPFPGESPSRSAREPSSAVHEAAPPDGRASRGRAEKPELGDLSDNAAGGDVYQLDTARSQVPSSMTMSEFSPRGKRKERRHLDMSDVHRQVRGGGPEPGNWNAGSFCTTRQRLLDEGKLEGMAVLTNMAAQASDAALEAGEYRLPSPSACHVQIPKRSHVQFYGLDTAEPPAIARASSMAPPLICSPLRVLEAAGEMVKMYPSNVVAASFDATDFSRDGKGLSGVLRARSAAQQEMFLRTNIEYYCKTAKMMCGEMRLQEQLTASSDPLALAASEVIIFRGPAENGYRFLPPEELVSINMLITGRSKPRPLLAGHGEYFAMQEDYLCFVDRLNLIARGAIAQAIQDHVAKEGTRDDVDKILAENRKPVLVIGAQDLTVAAAQQPRHSIATALKGWRLQWAHFFEAVVIACGDTETAAILDKTVNGNIYVTALSGKHAHIEGWHWHDGLLQMSVNNVLSNIAGRMKKEEAMIESQMPQSGRNAQVATQDEEPLSPRSKIIRRSRKSAEPIPQEAFVRRRSSVERAGTLSNMINDHNISMQLERQSISTQRVWSKQRSTISMPETPRASVPAPPTSQEDSRTAYERCLRNRLADQYVHDPLAEVKKRAHYQHPENEIQAAGGEKRAFAVREFMKVGKDTKKEAAQREKDKADHLDRCAKSLDMPDDIKSAITEEVRAAGACGQQQSVDHEKAVFDSVQSMAFKLDNRLEELRLKFQEEQEQEELPAA